MTRHVLAALLVAVLAACNTVSGTFTVSIKVAPGSDVLADVVRCRLTLSEPHAVAEASCGDGQRPALALDVPAEGNFGQVAFEGFDAGGELIAYGTTPYVPIAALDGAFAIYVARPMSMAAAPVSLPRARADMGVASLPGGVALVGGRYDGGAVADEMTLYAASAHELVDDIEPLPAPRAHPTVMAGTTGVIYVFGGENSQGAASAVTWRFDGVYSQLNSDGVQARARAAAAPRTFDSFVITGDPPLTLNGPSNRVAAFQNAPALAGTATTMDVGGTLYTLFAGAGSGQGAILLTPDAFTELEAPPAIARTGHGTVVLPDATFLTVAGAVGAELDPSLVIVNPQTAEAWVEDSALARLATPRRDAAVAASSAFVLVAGGVDAAGAVLGDAEIFDASTRERVTTLPLLVPRTEASAVALPSGHIMIAGGRDATGAPITTIELFTPAP